MFQPNSSFSVKFQLFFFLGGGVGAGEAGNSYKQIQILFWHDMYVAGVCKGGRRGKGVVT